ncbi:hypothetical protein BGZ79_005831, partial [Entomortierella chlamydospora]
GDPYLLMQGITFESRDLLDRYLNAVQKVVDRHDILRTAIMWENISSPVQVVLRRVSMSITELSLDLSDGPIWDQLSGRYDPRENRINLTQAPLMRFAIAQETEDCWVVAQLMHHLIGDHSAADVMLSEIQVIFEGQGDLLPEPQPFRNLIAQARSGLGVEAHQAFFNKMLSDIETPALPFGISDVHREGVDVIESHLALPHGLNSGLRSHAKRMG